jgi:alkaline phosphatase D
MSSETSQFLNPGLFEEGALRLWYRLRPGTKGRIQRENAPHCSGSLVVEGKPSRDGTGAISWPADAPGAEPLRAGEECHFVLLQDERVAARARFQVPAAASASTEGTLFAFASCHQPFLRDGKLDEVSVDALRAFHQLLRQRDPEFVLLLGDQVYADGPGGGSIFDDGGFAVTDARLRGADQIRDAMFRCYRHHWDVPGFRDILSDFSCLPILDDHEIVDNFGAVDEHQDADWARVKAGALEAYRAYQSSRIGCDFADEGPFHFSFRSPGCSTFTMDLRTQRGLDEEAPLLGRAQRADLKRFLESTPEDDVLVLGASVPPWHVSRTITSIASNLLEGADEFSDRWESPRFLADRDWFLSLLHEFRRRRPHQVVMVVGGDIHVGAMSLLRVAEGTAAIPQFISSAISHRPGLFYEFASAAALVARPRVLPLADGTEARLEVPDLGPAGVNPYLGLNLGLVSRRRDAAGNPGVDFELIGFENGATKTVFSYRIES